MKIIKQLREEIGISLERFAEMLDTTQQTIADWEAGHSEPTASALRDIAVIFGTSVDDLFGQNPQSDKVISTRIIMDFSREHSREAFWGNFGILTPGAEHTKWYPITDGEQSRITTGLANGNNWLFVTTLNNRALLVNLTNVTRLWLLNDDADQPEEDWEVHGDEYSGLPFEIYKGMDDFARENDAWFESSSEKYKEAVLNSINELSINGDDLLGKLHNTLIRVKDRPEVAYWVKPEALQSIILQAKMGRLGSIVQLPDYCDQFDSYFNTNNISVIDMPLLDLME